MRTRPVHIILSFRTENADLEGNISKRSIIIVIGLSGTLAGCGIAAKVDARNEYRGSVAAYKECLATHAPKDGEGQRLAMEADERQYDNLAAGITNGGNHTSNINIQNDKCDIEEEF
jgi:hypothetical protein